MGSVGDIVRSAKTGVSVPSASGAGVAACVVALGTAVDVGSVDGGATLDVLDARVVVLATVVDARVVVGGSHSVIPEPVGASD
jgi:hypothetical protein